MKKKQIAGIAVAAVLVLLVGGAGVALAASLRGGTSYNPEPTRDSVCVLHIVGEIGAGSYDIFGNPDGGYNQSRVLSTIKDMTASETNKGILLYVDSPGGAVFETDEVYLALDQYKRETGRPVWAYAHSMMASGAYYISCAAGRIDANRNATVGSIGVYIQTVNYAGLYDKLGIHGEYIRSGPNKAMGNSYDELTDEQRAIYQGIVDECYEQFLDIMCGARGYTREAALPIADGRSYTARQALANGLIDNLGTFDEMLAEFKTLCGVDTAYYRHYETTGILGWLGALAQAAPQNEYESALALVEGMESGVPMYRAE